LTAFRVAQKISLASEPSAILAGPSGTALVLSPGAGTVTIIDADLRVVRSRRLADHLSVIHDMPGSGHFVAANPTSQEVLLVETAGLRVVKRTRLQDAPACLDVAPATGLVAVASPNGAMNLLNFQTGEWRRAQLKENIGTVRFRQDGKLLLVSNPNDRLITAITVPDLKVMTELPLAMRPDNLCFVPNGGQLFVTGAGMDAVAIVFPYDTVQVEQTVLAGRDPGVMACSESYLFVASASGSDLAVLRVDTRKLVGLVQVGQRPAYVTLTPDGQYVLVLNEGSGDLAVIRVGAIRAIREKTGVGLFTLLPVGERPIQCGFVAKRA